MEENKDPKTAEQQQALLQERLEQYNRKRELRREAEAKKEGERLEAEAQKEADRRAECEKRWNNSDVGRKSNQFQEKLANVLEYLDISERERQIRLERMEENAYKNHQKERQKQDYMQNKLDDSIRSVEEEKQLQEKRNSELLAQKNRKKAEKEEDKRKREEYIKRREARRSGSLEVTPPGLTPLKNNDNSSTENKKVDSSSSESPEENDHTRAINPPPKAEAPPSPESHSTTGNNNRPQATSQVFQIFKDMECKEENQKYQLAGFLRELQRLAAQEDNDDNNEQKVPETLKKTSSNGNDPAIIKDILPTKEGGGGGNISLKKGIDWMELWAGAAANGKIDDNKLAQEEKEQKVPETLEKASSNNGNLPSIKKNLPTKNGGGGGNISVKKGIDWTELWAGGAAHDKIAQEEKEQKVPETLEKASNNGNLPSIKEILPTKEGGGGGNISLKKGIDWTELWAGAATHDKIDNKLPQEEKEQKVPETLEMASSNNGNLPSIKENLPTKVKGIMSTEPSPGLSFDLGGWVNPASQKLEGQDKIDDKLAQEEKEQKVAETLEKASSNGNLPSIKENLPTKVKGIMSTEPSPGLSFDLGGWVNPASQKLEGHDKIDDDKLAQEEKEQKVAEPLEKANSNWNLPSIKENLPTKEGGGGGNIPLKGIKSTELSPGPSFDLAGWMNPPSQKLEGDDKIDDKLAQENNEQKLPETLKKAFCTANLPSIKENLPTKEGGGDGNISLKGIELTELLPEIAHDKIDALLAGEKKLDRNSLLQLQQAAIKVMGEQETALDLRDKGFKTVTVVGDLHGSLDCLKCVIELVGLDRSGKNLKEDQVVIFGGDYVDRGGNSLEVLCTLLLLKLSHPESVHLLRGNHEDTMIASIYGFRDEIGEKYEDPDIAEEIWYEFGLVFAAIPICAWTKNAAVMHGGIPNEGFTLKRVMDVSPDVRLQLKTVVNPYDEDEEVVHGVMWSDPSTEPGIGPNDRGAGAMFGPDVAKAFLVEHGLKFLIRAHEPFEEGTDHLDLGDGCGVVTIFSASNYPNGEGTNLGAILHLDEEKGEYDIVTFDSSASPKEAVLVSEECARLLKMYVDDYRSDLTKAFRKLESKDGHVTLQQWAQVLGEVFDPDLPWLEFQPQLAPAEDGKINWGSFLNNFSSKIPKDCVLEEDQQSLSRQHKGEFLFQLHKDEFLNVFQLLDVNGSGKIGKQEFVQGVETLNERTSGAKLKDPEKLFEFFQTLRKPSRPPIVTKSISIQQFLRDKKNDGGKISVLEFCKGMEQLADMQGLAGKLDSKEVESLQENKEMLLLAFKHLGVNKRGAIDCEEFSRGIDLLNKGMPQGTMLGDPEELFKRLDADGKGEIDLIEFNAIFWSI